MVVDNCSFQEFFEKGGKGVVLYFGECVTLDLSEIFFNIFS